MRVNISDNKTTVCSDGCCDSLIKGIQKRMRAERIAVISTMLGALVATAIILIYKCGKADD